MKKKITMLFMAVPMAVFMTSCGSANMEETGRSEQETKEISSTSREEDVKKETDLEVSDSETVKANSLDELNNMVIQDLDNRINAINENYEKLKIEIDTYEKFLTSMESIEGFYENTYKETKEICIKMREYSIDYAKVILESEGNRDDKYDDLEELYDTVYDDGGEKIYDEIYDGILDEIYDVFYDGLLDEAYETAEYEEWSDARSDEYERWSDTRSEVYEEWSDTRSEIYEFWSDMRSEMWDADFVKAEEIIQEFQEDIAKLKEEQ